MSDQKLRLHDWSATIAADVNGTPFRCQQDDATIHIDIDTIAAGTIAFTIEKRAGQGDDWATLVTPIATQSAAGTLTAAITGLLGGENRFAIDLSATDNNTGKAYLVL